MIVHETARAFTLPFWSPKVSKTRKPIAVIPASVFVLLAGTTVSLDASTYVLKALISALGFINRGFSNSGKTLLPPE